MNSWQIGNVKITRVVELEVAGGTRFILPDATPDQCLPISWLAPHFMTEDGKLIMSIHALIIETGTRKIIVDTCIGNDKERNVPAWSHLQTSFLQDLEAAGYSRQDIDTVLCTHMHVDHVGWNTMLVDGEWQPTFPNARYLFGQKEWDHWQNENQKEYGSVLEDSIEPIIAAGQADFVDMNAHICPEVSLVPTPGHTPGHVSVHIQSEGEEAFITGDSIHHPCQMARLDWHCSADTDAQAAKATRTAMLEDMATKGILVIGTHFATPTAGHVKKEAEGGFRFEV